MDIHLDDLRHFRSQRLGDREPQTIRDVRMRPIRTGAELYTRNLMNAGARKLIQDAEAALMQGDTLRDLSTSQLSDC